MDMSQYNFQPPDGSSRGPRHKAQGHDDVNMATVLQPAESK